MIDSDRCPLCGQPKLINQPNPVLYSYTVFYECGSEIVYMIETEEYIVEIECKLFD